MRLIRGTALLLALALLVPLRAGAVPRRAQSQCVLRFELMDEGAVPDPFGRWLRELADLTVVTLEGARWDGGEAVCAQVRMGDREAFAFTLLRTGDGKVTLQSALAEGAAILSESDARVAARFMTACGALLRDGTKSSRALGLSAGYSSHALERCAALLEKWGGEGDGLGCEVCAGLSGFVAALGEKYAQIDPARELLRVRADYFQPDAAVDIAPRARPAEAGLCGELLLKALKKTARAIAALADE